MFLLLGVESSCGNFFLIKNSEVEFGGNVVNLCVVFVV